MTDQTPKFIKSIPNSDFGGRGPTPNDGFERAAPASPGFERTADPSNLGRDNYGHEVMPFVPRNTQGSGGEAGLPPPSETPNFDFIEGWDTPASPLPDAPFPCDPGPGEWSFQQGGVRASIANGELTWAGVSNSWDNYQLTGTIGGGGSFSRVPGTSLHWIERVNVVSGAFLYQVGFSDGTGRQFNDCIEASKGVGMIDRFMIGNNPLLLSADDLPDETVIERLVILRTTGCFHLAKSAAIFGDENWRLLYVTDVGANQSLYPFINVNIADESSLYINQAIGLYQDLFLPAILGSDSINRADNADLGSTDGLAHQEQHGGSGVLWQNLGDESVHIETNMFRSSGTTNGTRYLAGGDFGEPDVILRARLLTATTSNAGPSLMARSAVDGSTFLKVAECRVSTDELVIREYTGAYTIIAQTSAGPFNTDTAYEVTGLVYGDRIIGVVGDKTVVTATSTLNQTSNIHGFHGLRPEGSGDGMDWFECWSRSPPISPHVPPGPGGGGGGGAGGGGGQAMNQKFWVTCPRAGTGTAEDPYIPKLDFGGEPKSLTSFPDNESFLVNIVTTVQGKLNILRDPEVIEIPPPTAASMTKSERMQMEHACECACFHLPERIQSAGAGLDYLLEQFYPAKGQRSFKHFEVPLQL